MVEESKKKEGRNHRIIHSHVLLDKSCFYGISMDFYGISIGFEWDFSEILAGWCFGTRFFMFPFSGEFHHPKVVAGI